MVTFFNKRGTLIQQKMIIHIGMLLLAGFVWWMLNTYVNSIENNTQFHGKALSIDIALLANTIYMAPGELSYYYSNDKLNLEKFRLGFKAENDIPIIRVKENQLEQIYPYSKKSSYNYMDNVDFPNTIVFKKNGEDVEANSQ